MTEAGRDLRLDFFRGLALFCIFVDHLPDNLVSQFTLQSVMFGDAAEVFILISGYTAGMVYGRAMERQGFLIAALRVGQRLWQLYVAHVFLFMVFMAMMAYTVEALNISLYAEESQAADFLKDPGVAVVKALTLQFQPAYMDILPLYIVLLAALPFALTGFRFWPWVVLTASLGLWLAVQIDSRIALSAYPGPDRVWAFNPFGWQALFFLGAWLGWRGTRDGLPWLDRRWLFRLAAGFALVAFVIRFSWTLHGLYYADPRAGQQQAPVAVPEQGGSRPVSLRQRARAGRAGREAGRASSAVPGRPGRVAVRHLRPPLAAHLLSRDPARGDGAPGAQRVLRPRPHAARGLRGRHRDHDRGRGAHGLVRRREGPAPARRVAERAPMSGGE